MPEKPIILFDGVCNLCHGVVRFVIARDPQGQFRFASLQSSAAQRLMAPLEMNARGLDSIVLLEGGRAFQKSDAALRIVGRLSGPWPLLKVFLLVPGPLRDWIYGWVARHRYRWFGKKDSCPMPAPELQNRFLDE